MAFHAWFGSCIILHVLYCFQLLGLACFACGIWFHASQDMYSYITVFVQSKSDQTLLAAAGILLAVGIILSLLCILGIVGIILKSMRKLATLVTIPYFFIMHHDKICFIGPDSLSGYSDWLIWVWLSILFCYWTTEMSIQCSLIKASNCYVIERKFAINFLFNTFVPGLALCKELSKLCSKYTPHVVFIRCDVLGSWKQSCQ